MSMDHKTITFFAWRCLEATWLVLPSFLFNICYIFRCSWERWLVFRCTNCYWEINLRWNPIQDLLVTSMAHHSLVLLLGKSLQELTCMVSFTSSKQHWQFRISFGLDINRGHWDVSLLHCNVQAYLSGSMAVSSCCFFHSLCMEGKDKSGARLGRYATKALE